MRSRIWWIGSALLLVFGLSFFQHGEVCERAEYGYFVECTSHNIPYIVWHFVDVHNGIVAAIAAIFVALFTAVLTRVSRRQGAQIDREFAATHRAWVSIHDVEVTSLGIVRNPETKTINLWVEARFNLRNSGSTPALNTTIWRGAWLDGTESTPSEVAPIRAVATETTRGGRGEAIAPDSKAEQRINFVLHDLLETAEPGRLDYHIVKMTIAVAYTDTTSNDIRETVASLWIVDPRVDWTMQGFTYSEIDEAKGTIKTATRRIGPSLMT
jgi:hypothetical protein